MAVISPPALVWRSDAPKGGQGDVGAQRCVALPGMEAADRFSWASSATPYTLPETRESLIVPCAVAVVLLPTLIPTSPFSTTVQRSTERFPVPEITMPPVVKR